MKRHQALGKQISYKTFLNKPLLAGVLGTTTIVACETISGISIGPSAAYNTDATQTLPNIIMILADDLGYGDLGGYYGGQAKTPNLNRLAQEGMIFSDFHSNGPMSSPTRAALLTGRYQQRLKIETALPTDWEDRGISREVNKNEITIAEYLSNKGYSTAIFGKWHLGKHQLANPIHHGFDEFRGLMCGSGDYFSKMDRNGYRDWWYNEILSFQEGYTTHVITDNSIRFIESNKSKQFFLYVAYNAIHFPWQTAEDYNLETVREGEDFTSNLPGFKSKLGPHMPEQIPSVLIEMIEELDKSVGRIIATLHEQGIEHNTVVFFTSDNGGYLNYGSAWLQVGSNGPLKGQKGQVFEGGHRVPAIAWWPGRIQDHSLCDQQVMTFDLLPTILDLLGIQFPSKDSYNAFDGISILPLLLKGKKLEPRTLFWRMGNQKAVRRDNWKLVLQSKEHAPELYNIMNDLGETHNLAAQYPEIVRQLIKELDAWENDVDH